MPSIYFNLPIALTDLHTYFSDGMINVRPFLTLHLRSSYMPITESIPLQSTHESLQKTPSTLYKDPQHPTADELYYVLLHNISYVDLSSISTSYSACNNLGPCDGCPFTDNSVIECFLDDDQMLPAVDKLRQTHPELFI